MIENFYALILLFVTVLVVGVSAAALWNRVSDMLEGWQE